MKCAVVEVVLKNITTALLQLHESIFFYVNVTLNIVA